MSLPEDQNIAAKYFVVGTLLSQGISRLNFTIGSVRVNSAMFQQVAKKVFLGEIGVTYCPWMNAHAEYYSGNSHSFNWDLEECRVKNSFHLGFSSGSDPRYASLVVHEAVHAGFDMEKRAMNHMTNEAIAYITQALFYLVSRQSTLGGPILGPATSIAKQIARKAPIDPQYMIQLRDDILANPLYQQKDMMNGQAVNNGI